MDLASPSLACLFWPASIYLVVCHLWSDYLLAVHPTLHILSCDSRAGAALQGPFLRCQQTSLYIRPLGTPRRMWRGRVEEVMYSMLCFWWSLLQFSFPCDYCFSHTVAVWGHSFPQGPPIPFAFPWHLQRHSFIASHLVRWDWPSKPSFLKPQHQPFPQTPYSHDPKLFTLFSQFQSRKPLLGRLEFLFSSVDNSACPVNESVVFLFSSIHWCSFCPLSGPWVILTGGKEEQSREWALIRQSTVVSCLLAATLTPTPKCLKHCNSFCQAGMESW